MECWCHGKFTTSCFFNVTNLPNQIWDLFEGKHMFHGNDPDGKGYSTRAHLAEVIEILGPPPADILKHGIRSKEFFDEDGEHKYSIPQTFCA